MNFKKKKILIYSTIFVLLLGLSFIIYTSISANSGNNRIKVNYVTMSSIRTGAGSFNSSDGLAYATSDSSDYSNVTNYTPGLDANANNRIVRSFDTLTYNFDFMLKDKQESMDYYDRTVKITVELSADEAKYIAFERNGNPGILSKEYTFDGIDTDSEEEASVTLYVLGAPNGTSISPKFTIKESTDEEAGIVLGKSGSTTNYSFRNYNYSNVCDFMNYMPTVVSSKDASLSLRILTSSSDSTQNSIYNGQTGRYITYVAGLKLNADATTGIKGLVMPTGDITYDVSFTQTGSNTPSFDDKWARLYGPTKLDEINPIVVNLPYSADSTESNKTISNPGSVSVATSGSGYKVTISGYNISSYFPSVGADNESLGKDGYINSVAFTTFSPRTRADGKNDVTVTMNASNGSATLTNGSNVSIPSASASNINKYYEVSDFSLVGEFYDFAGGTKISTPAKPEGANYTVNNGTGSISKGTSLLFRTKFDYNKTNSDNGLKEVIKIDNNAYRFIPIRDGVDYEIELNCAGGECKGISPEDFEVKFLSGTFDASNYSANNVSTMTLGEEDIDKELVTSQCATVASNLSNYNVNQIQNLYGGPCIVANEGVETEYTKISSAKKEEDSSEIQLTKAVIQTKDGVKLPDNISVVVKVGVRVRNVTDLTQPYQATVVTSTSDYDNYTYYYSPIVSTVEDNVTNPNNYVKPVYQGTKLMSADTSMFGDALRIVNFTSREEITVTNKNADGTTKTNYDVKDNETITYNVKTTIEDNNMEVGADDVWYINDLVVKVEIPKELEYFSDSSLRQPYYVDSNASGTTLYYSLPYTKPNMTIPEIQFRTRLKPTLIETSYPITVTSTVNARNINNEVDNSLFGLLSSSFTIYGTGIKDVIVQQEVGKSGTVIEKNGEINYVLKAYNNTGKEVKEYSIIDVLPYKGDDNKSQLSGTYSVKVTLPDSIADATVLCSKDTPSKIRKEPLDTENKFEACDVTESFVDKVTAIKITGINIPIDKYMGDVVVSLKTKGNNYEDTYNNSFVGETKELTKNTSNIIKVSVVSRKISGKVFLDISGDGVQDGNEKFIAGIPVTLYSIDDENGVKKVSETSTDKDGKYSFKNLDRGRYKIGFNYDINTYDLTLRYATEDTDKDSDAYKVSDSGQAEITNKKIPDDPNGIRLSKEITEVKNMDMGLLGKQSFGFSMRKYITRVELNYNGSVTPHDYNNESVVALSVRDSRRASAKVYYGIEIRNNSNKSGFINEIQDYLPNEMIFDGSLPENSAWIQVSDGMIMTDSLSETLIKPGEAKYLQIVLYMPERDSTGTFLNTVAVTKSTVYDPDALADDAQYVNGETYKVGDEITYAGVDWNVIKSTGDEVTLLAKSGTISDNMSHTLSAGSTYKWSESQINAFINGNWADSNTLDLPSLKDNVICDDASGLQDGSYGGTMGGQCISGMYITTKVRLLTLDEYTALTTDSNLSDTAWLYGNKSFWLQNTDYVSPYYLEQYINAYNNTYSNPGHTTNYGLVDYGIQQNSVYNKAMYINITSHINTSDIANTAKEVRPVITVPVNSIIVE